MRESGDKRGFGESGCSGVKKVSADVEPRNVTNHCSVGKE